MFSVKSLFAVSGSMSGSSHVANYNKTNNFTEDTGINVTKHRNLVKVRCKNIFVGRDNNEI